MFPPSTSKPLNSDFTQDRLEREYIMAIQLNIEQVKTLLKKSGQVISSETRSGNNLGTVLKLSNGGIINCWDKGTVNCQGKNQSEIEKILVDGVKGVPQNNKVFVVYGHDKNARTQLEAMLRRWDLEPLILDQLPSDGGTVIEKLERYTNQAGFGIVLATPDDIGYAKNNEAGKKYRVRQNVVLELGMLLATKGRSKVAILLSQAEDMESPSDINGLIYIPFKENVEDAALSLAKEMNRNGYTIEISKL